MIQGVASVFGVVGAVSLTFCITGFVGVGCGATCCAVGVTVGVTGATVGCTSHALVCWRCSTFPHTALTCC